MGFEHFQLSKAGAAFRHKTSKSKRASTTSDPSCATGAFYTSPMINSSYPALTPLTIAWDPALSCLLPAPSYVDLYLYAPASGLSNPKLHLWTGVNYAAGAYNATLMPRWWNSTAAVDLQVLLVPTGEPPFLSPIPAGPVFTATYAAPANGSTPAAADTSLSGTDSGTTTVTTTSVSGVSTHKLSGGKTAAAVLLPLLFLVLLGLAYLKISRARGAAKRSAWSEKLDKRMSTISETWKPVTAVGAREAVRQSIAYSRNSVFSFSNGARNVGPVEGEPVVMGEKPRSSGSVDIAQADLPRTSLGSGVGVGVGARRPRTHATPPERGSRAVSFADAAHPRPSLSNSVYSRTSRAFHTASTYNADGGEEEAPPVPALPSPSRISAYGDRASAYTRGSEYSGGADRGHSVYVGANGAAWSSGERVEGVDGGYGARSVSPTGRVHSIVYPDSGAIGGAEYYAYEGTSPAPTYTTHAQSGSYFSPTTPTPTGAFPAVYEPSADSAYNSTTFGAYPSPGSSEPSSGLQSGITSPRQTAGPLTLTPDDIRRRMTLQQHGGNQSGGEWRQSVDEVFGALSLMRTGSTAGSPNANSPDGAEDAGDDYLFAPVQETVFAYPGTPVPGAGGFSTPSAPSAPASSPFAMRMSAAAMSPDDMLRAYAATHEAAPAAEVRQSRSPSILAKALPLGMKAKASPLSKVSPLSNSTQGAEVVHSLHGTGMRVLYAQPDSASRANTSDAASTNSGATGGMIPAGPRARLSR